MTESARPTGPVPTLESRVTWLESQVSKAAGILRRPDLVDRAESDAAFEAGRGIAVIVAGETSRGKSSLVNAILERPNLIPNAADVTTNVYLTIRHGSPESARVFVEGNDVSLPVGLDTVGQWSTVDGNPDNVKAVRAVDLLIDHPLLAKGVMIVDTPGVGGIEAAHAEMTLVALSHADALLFVKGAQAPISGPEATFLTRAAERIETVIICLTKTDLFPGWATIAAQDREFLGRYLPRFKDAPILPVSSVLAEAARQRAATSPASASALRAASGFDELLRTIDERIVRPGVALRLGNRVRGSITAIEAMADHVRARAGSARGDSKHRADLETAHARLLEYRKESGGWNVLLGDDLQRLRSSMIQALNLAIHETRTALAPANMKRPEDGVEFTAELQRRLNDMLARLNAGLIDGMAALGGRLRETLSLEGIDLRPAAIDLAIQPGGGVDAALVETDSERAATMARGIMSAVSPAMTLSFISAGNPVLIGTGVVLGLGLVVVERVTRARSKDLANARQVWGSVLADTTRRAEIDIPFALDNRLLDIRRATEIAVRAGLDERIAQLTTAEADLKALLQAEESVKQKAIADAETSLKSLATLKSKGESYLSEGGLSGTRTPAPSPTQATAV